MGAEEGYNRYKATQQARDDQKRSKGLRAYWKQSSDKIALLVLGTNVVLALATLGLYLATVNLVSDSEKASDASTRAYIAVTGVKWDGVPEVGKNQRIKILFKNVGKEAASNFTLFVNVSNQFDFEPDSKGMPYVPPDKVNWPYVHCGGELPGQQIIGQRPVYPDVPNEAIWYAFNPGGSTPGAVFVPQRLLDGKTTIVVSGCAVYRSLGKTRHSPFCFYYQPARGQDVMHGTFEWCPTGTTNAD